ncbi:MAG: RHS repeat-associated core domain-containing protein [bacterium]
MRYDKNNQRVQKKVVSGTTTNYMRDIRGLVLAVFNSTTISERYVWGPLGIVAIVKGNNSSPTSYYTIKDHLGAVRTVVNTGGTAVAGYDYYPYGLNLRSSVNAGASCRFLFGGKELDSELSLDLYYFEARFYNPEIGRFVSPDPLRIGWSPYPFANNNPLRWVDPTGLGPQEPDQGEDIPWAGYPNGVLVVTADAPPTYDGKTLYEHLKEAADADTVILAMLTVTINGLPFFGVPGCRQRLILGHFHR